MPVQVQVPSRKILKISLKHQKITLINPEVLKMNIALATAAFISL